MDTVKAIATILFVFASSLSVIGLWLAIFIGIRDAQQYTTDAIRLTMNGIFGVVVGLFILIVAMLITAVGIVGIMGIDGEE